MAKVTDFFKASKPEMELLPKLGEDDIDRVGHPKVADFLNETPSLTDMAHTTSLTELYRAFLFNEEMSASEIDKYIETFKNHRLDKHLTTIISLLVPFVNDKMSIVHSMGKQVTSRHRLPSEENDKVICGPTSFYTAFGDDGKTKISIVTHSEFTSKETRFSDTKYNAPENDLIDDVFLCTGCHDIIGHCHPKRIKKALRVFEDIAILLQGNLDYTREDDIHVFSFKFVADLQHMVYVKILIPCDTYHITFKPVVHKFT